MTNTDNNRRFNKHCVNCGKPITDRAIRCKQCNSILRESTKKLPPKICGFCGKEFYTHRKINGDIIFCSRDCQKKYHYAKLHKFVCPVCGKEFVVKDHPNRIVGNPTCSRSCSVRNRIIKFPRRWAKQAEYNCTNCGKTFFRHVSTVRNPDIVFCSISCKIDWWRGSNVPSCTFEKRICEICGTEFVKSKRLIEMKGGKYCSRTCSSASQIIPGSVDYRGPNWNEQRRKARHRDKYTCQVCGKSEVENGRALSVHHIVPFRLFDIQDYKLANSMSNLISLCLSCHRKVENGKIKI